MALLKLVLAYLASIVFFFGLMPGAVWWLGTRLDDLLDLPSITFAPITWIIGGLIWVVGTVAIVWGIVYIQKIGEGHPEEVFGAEFTPTTVRLITTGPFAYTRNPLGFGCILVNFGTQLVYGTLGGTVLAPVLMYGLFKILLPTEEKGLAERFGEEYEQYRRDVPFIWPRLRSRPGPSQGNG